jgi:hypothetical protein
MPNKADFETTFENLKSILEPYAGKLVVAADTDRDYKLNVNHVMKNKQQLFFGGVSRGKSYVSFHLMPVYALPELSKTMSPELRRRMQGKSCFNFSSPDEKLFKELSKLTKIGFTKFTNKKFYTKF